VDFSGDGSHPDIVNRGRPISGGRLGRQSLKERSNWRAVTYNSGLLRL
jgi:hypothetical protein